MGAAWCLVHARLCAAGEPGGAAGGAVRMVQTPQGDYCPACEVEPGEEEG